MALSLKKKELKITIMLCIFNVNISNNSHGEYKSRNNVQTD